MPSVWVDKTISNTVSTGAQLQVRLDTGLTLVQTRLTQMTLLRTIIGLSIARTVHDSGEGSEILSLGIGIVSQEAFSASVLPDPEAEQDFPPRGWIFRGMWRIFGFAADQPAIHVERVDRDIRAQRKLENGVPFLVATVGNIEGVNSTVDVRGLIRQLWLVR